MYLPVLSFFSFRKSKFDFVIFILSVIYLICNSMAREIYIFYFKIVRALLISYSEKIRAIFFVEN